MPEHEVSELQSAIAEAATRAWEQIQTEFGDQQLYGFALYTTDVCQYITCTAFSEEGLAEVVAEYGDGSTESGLRFSPADSPLHTIGEQFFYDLVDPLLDERYLDGDDEDLFAAEVQRRFDACFAALTQLDREGLFDQIGDRDRFVLNVLQGDQSDNSRLANAQRLNPAATIEWYDSFLHTSNNDQVVASVGEGKIYQVDDLAVAGNHILIAAQSVHHVRCVAPATFRSENKFGGSVNAVAIGPDGETVWMCGDDFLSRTSLSDPSFGESVCVLDDRGFFVSPAPDGSRVLTAGFNRLDMYQHDGTKLWSRSREALHPRCAWNPKTGALLSVSESGVRWIDPETGADRDLVDDRKDGTTCTVSPDGSLVAAGFGHSYNDDLPTLICVYQTAENRLVWATELKGSYSISGLSFNSENLLVAGTARGPAHVFDPSGASIGSVRCRLESIHAVEWIDEDVFIACGRDVDTGPPALAFSVSALVEF